MRWVPRVGHIDHRQSVLSSSCAPLPDSMNRVVTHIAGTLPALGWGCLTISSVPGVGYLDRFDPTISRGGGGVPWGMKLIGAL